MKTRTKVTTATLALGALALSGGTLALWSDTDDIAAANVESGHLDLRTDDLVAFDVSDFREPRPGTGSSSPYPPSWTQHTVGNALEIGGVDDLAEFRFVPGDVVRVVVPIDVDLEGNNLAATLDVTLTNEIQAMGFQVTGMGIVSSDGLAEGANSAKGAAEYASAWGLDYKYFTPANDDDDFYAVYQITFDDADSNGLEAGNTTAGADNENRMDVTLSNVIESADVTLTQIRQNA